MIWICVNRRSISEDINQKKNFFNGDVQDQNPSATHLSMCNLFPYGSNFAKPFQDHSRTVLHLEHRLIVSVFHVPSQ